MLYHCLGISLSFKNTLVCFILFPPFQLKKTMEKPPWPIYKIKEPWEVPPYPQLSLISEKLYVCRQAPYRTCHHQHSDIMFILIFNLFSFLLTAEKFLL
jgi:hypothetical protein